MNSIEFAFGAFRSSSTGSRTAASQSTHCRHEPLNLCSLSLIADLVICLTLDGADQISFGDGSVPLIISLTFSGVWSLIISGTSVSGCACKIQMHLFTLQAEHVAVPAHCCAVVLAPPTFTKLLQPALLLQPSSGKGGEVWLYCDRVPPWWAVFQGRWSLWKPQRPVREGLHGKEGLRPGAPHPIQRDHLHPELQLLWSAIL